MDDLWNPRLRRLLAAMLLAAGSAVVAPAQQEQEERETIDARVLERISRVTPAPRLEALRAMESMEQESRRNSIAPPRFAAESLRWTSIGPAPGRVTALAVD